MNQLTAKQRKLTYFAGILILIIPIIWLGMPSTGEENSGGKLAQLRQEYDLGESTLGEIDPSSATMNLVLLGLKGVAANKLWMDANDYHDKKNWGMLKTAVDSIVLLQPHFIEVWRFQGWNLAFNVSAEWDGVPDRFYWVKEGAKFIKKGIERNRQSPKLYWTIGRVLGPKIGIFDEKKYYRKFFKNDPDPKFKGGPDKAINPQGKDNFLVAREWFLKANEADLKLEIKESITNPDESGRMMKPVVFHHFPTRQLFHYGDALKRDYAADFKKVLKNKVLDPQTKEEKIRQLDGLFEERIRTAYDLAYREWTEKYGRQYFEEYYLNFKDGSTKSSKFFLEVTPEDIQQLANENDLSEEEIKTVLRRVEGFTNYSYWKTVALSEREQNTIQAHLNFYKGKSLFRLGHYRKALPYLEKSMDHYERLFQRFPSLKDPSKIIVEKAFTTIWYWTQTLEYNSSLIEKSAFFKNRFAILDTDLKGQEIDNILENIKKPGKIVPFILDDLKQMSPRYPKFREFPELLSLWKQPQVTQSLLKQIGQTEERERILDQRYEYSD